MLRSAAIKQGCGYAWGFEDASGVPTAVPAGSTDNGSWAFANAWGQSWADYLDDKSGSVMSVARAYLAWQESGGSTVTESPVARWLPAGTEQPLDMARDTAVPGVWALIGPNGSGYGWTIVSTDDNDDIDCGTVANADAARRAVWAWERQSLPARTGLLPLAADERGEG